MAIEITQAVALQVFKGGNPYNPDISQDSDGKWRIHIAEAGDLALDGYGEVAALPAGDDGTITLATTAKTRVYGFTCWGDTDALAELNIDGVWMGADVISIFNRIGRLYLPRGPLVPAGKQVVIAIKNIHPSDTGNYKAILHHEVIEP